jgi:hypothetical protein
MAAVGNYKDAADRMLTSEKPYPNPWSNANRYIFPEFSGIIIPKLFHILSQNMKIVINFAD